MSRPAGRWRSVLFAPANQPGLVPKLNRTFPDVVALDLEDAVPISHKAQARAMVVDAIAALGALEHHPLVGVRVNGVHTPFFADDLACLASTGVELILLPKLEHVDDARAAVAALQSHAWPGSVPVLVAGIETARGVADARLILASSFVACYFGAEDFVTDMGGVRTTDNAEINFARSNLALSARVCGVAPLDVVTTDFHDLDRFRREAGEARALGYSGKLCIHPAQVPLAHEAFAPNPAEIERAHRILRAWADANACGLGAIAFEGQLVDEAMAARARAVLAAIVGS